MAECIIKQEKLEKVDLAAYENEMLAVLDARKSVSNEDLVMFTPGMDGKTRSEVVNSLLAAGKVEMLPGTSQGSFFLRVRKGMQLANATPEEQLVFSLIEESDKKGIWIRDMRNRTGLSQMHMRKALKSLEQRKLVKSMKAVGTTKKCYMLFDMEADDSLTGGAFYSEQQFDTQFVQVLVQVCVSMLQTKRKMAEEEHREDPALARELSSVSVEDMTRYVREKGISRVKLTERHLEKILQVAALDAAVERRMNGTYRALSLKRKNCSLTMCPCVHCPVAADCSEGHEISPATCAYYTCWLDRTKKMPRFNPTRPPRKKVLPDCWRCLKL